MSDKATEGLVVWIARDPNGQAWWFCKNPVRFDDGQYFRSDEAPEYPADWGPFRSALMIPGLLPGECRRYQLREVTDE